LKFINIATLFMERFLFIKNVGKIKKPEKRKKRRQEQKSYKTLFYMPYFIGSIATHRGLKWILFRCTLCRR